MAVQMADSMVASKVGWTVASMATTMAASMVA